MVYIAERRLTKRSEAIQVIKVYSNQKKVELFVNGKRMVQDKGDYGCFLFNVILKPGENIIIAKSGKDKMNKVNLYLEKN